MTGTALVFVVLLQAAPVGKPTPRQAPPPKQICGIDTSELDPARDLTPPKRIKFVEPGYPEAAVKAGKSGSVVIEMLITEAGKPSGVKVKQGIDPDLDQAALDAVKQWEYAPLLARGKPCASVMSVTVNFKFPAEEPAPTDGSEAQPPRE